MRFVYLTAGSKLILVQYLSGNSLRERERKRFSAIFLSSENRLGVAELSKTFSVSQTSILSWFNSYKSGGFGFLLDGEISPKSSLSDSAESIILDKLPKDLKI